MAKDKPKNWWDDDETVTTSDKTTNWWDQDETHPASPVATPSSGMSAVASTLGITKPGTQAGVVKKPMAPAMLARPQAPVAPVDPNNGIDPLAPKAGEEWRKVDRSRTMQPPSGTIPMVTYDGAGNEHTVWIPNPAAQMRAEAKVRAATKELQDFRDERGPVLTGISDAIIGKLKEGDQAIASAGNAALNVVDPNRNASKFLSENVTPAAEQFGRSAGSVLSGADPNRQGLADATGAVTGGISEWGATTARDPVQGLGEATNALEPTHYVAEGYNDLRDALGAAFQQDWQEFNAKMGEANPKLLMGTAGMLPGGSLTIDALKNMGKGGGPSIASQLFKPGPTSLDRAADILIKKMKADGLTIDDLRKVQGSLARRGDSGVYETLSEVAGLSDKSSGANLRGLAMALGAVPGPAQEALIARVAENADLLPKRLNRAATRATGQSADNAVSTLDELDARLKKEAGPAYDNFYAAQINPEVYAQEIEPVLNAPHGQQAMDRAARGLGVQAASLQARAAAGGGGKEALERAYEAANALKTNLEYPQMLAQARKAAEGGSPEATQAFAQLQANPPPPLPPLALDHVKRAFDDLIDEAGQGTYTGGNLRSAKNNFSESVDRATGGAYGNALGTYEGIKRLEDAFTFGTEALNKKSWQLEREMSQGLKGRAWSKGEIEAIALGVARNIEDLIEAGDNAALTRLNKGKALKNIATALGDPEAAAMFEESMNRLAANREWGRRVAGGSDTAMRQAAIKDAATQEEDPVTRTLARAKTASAPPTLTGAVWNAVGKPVVEKAEDAYRRFRYPGIYDEGVNEALAPLMARPLTKGGLDEIASTIEQRLAAKGKKALPPPSDGPKGGPKGGGSGGSPKKLPPTPAASLSGPPKPPVKMGFGGGQPEKRGLQSAAVLHNGKVYTGATHEEAGLKAGLTDRSSGAVPGFIDSRGRFVGQYNPEAALDALAAGQIKDPATRKILEDQIRNGGKVTLLSDHVQFPNAPSKAGFGSKLDTSEAARMQRAREQGFDVETPWFHAGNLGDEVRPDAGELGLHIGNEDAATLVQQRGITRKVKPQISQLYVRGSFAQTPDIGNFRSPYMYLTKRADEPRAFDRRYSQMWAELDQAAKAIPKVSDPNSPELTKALAQWRSEVHAAAKRNNLSGWEYINNAEGGGEPSRVVFDPAAVRKADASFDPSQSGSSKLLAGMGKGDRPEMIGALAGGAGGATFAQDDNGDGVIDLGERLKYAAGGAFGTAVATGMGRTAINALKDVRAPKGVQPVGPRRVTSNGFQSPTIAADTFEVVGSADHIRKLQREFKDEFGRPSSVRLSYDPSTGRLYAYNGYDLTHSQASQMLDLPNGDLRAELKPGQKFKDAKWHNAGGNEVEPPRPFDPPDEGLVVYRGSAEDEPGVIENGRLGLGKYAAEDPEIGAEWGGQSGKVDAYRVKGRLFDLDETTAQGLENYEKQVDTPAAQTLKERLKAEGYVGIRDPWSGHINVFDERALVRHPAADKEIGSTWTNDDIDMMGFGGGRKPVATSDSDILRAVKELTPREFEVWKAARQGMSNPEIRDQLAESGINISSTAVSVYRGRAQAKGFSVPQAKQGRPTDVNTDAVRKALARGVEPAVIADEYFPNTPREEALTSIRGIKRWDKQKSAPKPPPAQMGFAGGKGPSGFTDAIVDAYGNFKRGLLPNDPRHLNAAAEALQGMSPVERALIERNAAQGTPVSAMEAGNTPASLAELVGRAVSQNAGGADKPMDAAAKAYQTRLAEQILGNQRHELMQFSPNKNGQAVGALVDPINADKAAGPIGPMEKAILGSYDWTPAREAQQEAALAALIAEGVKPGGGIPQNAGALDRFREGTAQGAKQPPLMISPRDENRIADLIFNPSKAQDAAQMMNAPVKPWVSDLERKAIQVGVPATGLAAMIAAGTSLYNQPGGEATADGQPPQPVPGSGPDSPIYTVPDRLVGTSNPAEPPPELNGYNRDTRIRAQQRLMALGYAPQNLKPGVRFDDGVDGEATRAAVMRFQRENNLPVTGDLDPMTLRTLWGGKNFGLSPVMRNYGEELAPAPQ